MFERLFLGDEDEQSYFAMELRLEKNKSMGRIDPEIADREIKFYRHMQEMNVPFEFAIITFSSLLASSVRQGIAGEKVYEYLDGFLLNEGFLEAARNEDTLLKWLDQNTSFK